MSAGAMFASSVDISRPTSLESLPYDLVLLVGLFLNLKDIHSLHVTCRTLHNLTMNRPIYRECAASLLARCRALPLQRFSAINDLSLAQLRRAVNKAARWEQAWRTRGPRPIPASSASTDSTDLYENEHSNYMDNFMPLLPDDPQWYRIVDSPTGEIIDWLSPITNSYVLCSTKSGKVILSSLTNSTPDNKPIATWCPKGRKWELWKCRVEFEEQSVYFCMAREIKDKSGQSSNDGNRTMEFTIVKLSFPPGADASPPTSSELPLPGDSQPQFTPLTTFKTFGVVMNVFLLDPSQRLLSAFVWCSTSNTIGLYVLLDWDKDEYIFVDTQIECRSSSNWSCILSSWPGSLPYIPPIDKTSGASTPSSPPEPTAETTCNCIVIHSEEGDRAYQHFYPLPLLSQHIQQNATSPTLPVQRGPAHDREGRFRYYPGRKRRETLTPSGKLGLPRLSGPLTAPLILERSFDFPEIVASDFVAADSDSITGVENITASATMDTSVNGVTQESQASSPMDQTLEDGSGPIESIPDTGPHPTLLPTTSLAAVVQHADGPSSTLVAPSQATEEDIEPDPPIQYPNPFPFPPWYPESAHFVRQWWPTFNYPNHQWGRPPPRVSCTVVLLSTHDPDELRWRFILSQHYFSVPLFNPTYPGPLCAVLNHEETPGVNAKGKQKASEPVGSPDPSNSSSEQPHVSNMSFADRQTMAPWYAPTPFEVVCIIDSVPGDFDHAGSSDSEEEEVMAPVTAQQHQHQASHEHLQQAGDDDDDEANQRPRPLIAVDFGHAVWLEYVENPDDPAGAEERREERTRQRTLHGRPRGLLCEQLFKERKERQETMIGEGLDPFEDDYQNDLELDLDAFEGEDEEVEMVKRKSVQRQEAELRRRAEEEENEFDANLKWLRFVTFPPFDPEGIVLDKPSTRGNRMGLGGSKIHKLEIPPELDLDAVETVNLDQSQGAVILSVKAHGESQGGRIFVLCYE